MSKVKEFVDLMPSFALDFANSQKIHPALLVARPATTMACIDGQFKTVAANSPCLDIVNGTCRGLRSEGITNNFFLNSEFRDSTAWSLTADEGVTMVLDQPSLVAGAKSIELTSYATDGITQDKGISQVYATSPSFVTTQSLFVRKKPGSKNCGVKISAEAISNSGAHVRQDFLHTFASYENDAAKGNEYLGDGWWRIWFNFKTPPDATVVLFSIHLTDENFNTAFDSGGHSVQVSVPQAERGLVPTSPILTYDSIAQRVLDRQQIDVSAYLGKEGFTVAYVSRGNNDSSYPVVFSSLLAPVATNQVGVRSNGIEFCIDGSEGVRTVGTGFVPSERKRAVVVATISNTINELCVDGVFSTSMGRQYSYADYTARKYMKLNGHYLNRPTPAASFERVLLWNKPLNKVQMKAVADLLI